MSTPPPTPRLTRLPLGRSARRVSYERRLRLSLLALGVPAPLLAGVVVWNAVQSWTLALAAAGSLALVWALAAMYVSDGLLRPLQTLSNVVAALREDDFSFRARGGRRNDSLGDLALEINALAGSLQAQRSSARDALALLERIMGSMPSPVLAFDREGHLRMVNQAARQLFRLPARGAIGQAAEALGIAEVLELGDQALYTHVSGATHVADADGVFPAEAGGARSFAAGPAEIAAAPDPLATRWSVRRAGFRLQGVPHTLLVLSDVAAVLREEERVAWQRLIRVLSHEINNSLTPIQSIAGSLRGRLAHHEGAQRPTLPADAASDGALAGDAVRGLGIIEERAASLNRFLQAYQQLTRLPPPSLRPVSLGTLLEGAAALEMRLPVTLRRGPAVVLPADADQLGQLLINLLRNAVDAALQGTATARNGSGALRDERGDQHAGATAGVPEVLLGWTVSAGRVLVQVRDNGPGLSSSANLFVPFYTTKRNGTGVGLVLARQIAVAHHGTLTLSNRADGVSGCTAELQLPL